MFVSLFDGTLSELRLAEAPIEIAIFERVCDDAAAYPSAAPAPALIAPTRYAARNWR